MMAGGGSTGFAGDVMILEVVAYTCETIPESVDVSSSEVGCANAGLEYTFSNALPVLPVLRG